MSLQLSKWVAKEPPGPGGKHGQWIEPDGSMYVAHGSSHLLFTIVPHWVEISI